MDEKRDSFNFYIQGKHILHFILYVMFCLCFHSFFSFRFCLFSFVLPSLFCFVLFGLILLQSQLSVFFFFSSSCLCLCSASSFRFISFHVFPDVFWLFVFKFCFLFKFQEILQQTIDEISNKERYFTSHLLVLFPSNVKKKESFEFYSHCELLTDIAISPLHP